jgi:hypothetical protein
VLKAALLALGSYSDYNASVCNYCTSGRYSDVGASLCQICASGSFNEASGSSQCSLCPAGKWSSLTGQTTGDLCTLCPAGRYSEIAGVASGEQCLLCPQGTYGPNFGASNSSQCIYCPQSAAVLCNQGAVVPLVKQGYWTDGLSVVGCVPDESCIGGNFTAGASLCGAGYTGRACYFCDKDYFRLLGYCKKCVAKALRYIILLIAIVFFIIASYKALSSTRRIPVALGICLFWFQMLSLYPVLFDRWPTELQFVFNFSGVVNLDIGYFGFGCDLKASFYSVMIIKLLIPFALWLNFCAFEMFKLRSIRIKKATLVKVTSYVLVAVNLFSVQLFSTLFQIFNCVPEGNGAYVIKADPSVQCYDKSWTNIVIADSLFIIFYIICIPILFLLAFRQASTSPERKKEMQVLIQRITGGYRVGAEHFELLKLCFKLAFVLIRDVLSFYAIWKSCLLTLLFSLKIHSQSQLQPYQNPTQNSLSMM